MKATFSGILLTITLCACGAKETAPVAAPDVKRLLALSDPSSATAVDANIRKLQKEVGLLPKKAELWIKLGRAWVQKARNTGDPGFYLNADACAVIALELEPQNPLALSLRGIVLLNDHRFAEARDLAKGILSRDADDAMALGVLSDAELELGNLPGAIEAAEKMMSKKPDLPSYSRISYLRWLRGDGAGAIEAMRLAFDAGRGQKDPEPAAWALSQIATYFWMLGDIDGAEAGYSLTLEYLPNYAPALVGAGKVSMARGHYSVAAERLRLALENQPLVETAWLLGDALAMASDMAGAEKAYAEAEKLGRQADPRSLALFWATKNREPSKALELARKELEKRPGPHSRDTYAFALLRAGKAAEAAKVIEPVIAMGIDEPAVKYHAGLIALANGDTAGGEKLLREVMEKTPHFDLSGAEEIRKILGR